LSIVELCIKKDRKEITFEEIVILTISKLWYPVNYFKLSFGKIDQCSKFVKQIQLKYNLEDNISQPDLFDFLIKNNDSDLLVNITKELTRYVPFRFIRPWYSEQTRGLKDSYVNNKILELQDGAAPYNINVDLKKIILNESWFNWIQKNYKLIKSYTYFELIKYLEKENPNTANLSKKLEKPSKRKLYTSTKYWKSFIVKEPSHNDVFENKSLLELKELSIDHFLPWSFVAHDLIWNLHPVERNINSSKNNFLPSIVYFDKFYSLQYNFCKFLIGENFHKPLENYYILFNCSFDNLNDLSKEQFVYRMENYYSPQIEIAKNMGFEGNWHLS